MEGLGPLILIAIPLMLLFLLSSRARRQQREVATVQSRLEVGQQVLTASGMYATITDIDGDVITLESVPGAASRWDRRAVVKVLPGPAEDIDDELDEAAEPDERDGQPQDGPAAPPRPAGS